jgi:hypothetical protein
VTPAPPRAPGSTHRAPDAQDRLHLVFDVRQDGPIAVSPQALVDKGSKHHLEAHGPFESGRGRPREHPGSIQNLSGNHEKDLGLVLEHRHFPVLPASNTCPVIVRRYREAWKI